MIAWAIVLGYLSISFLAARVAYIFVIDQFCVPRHGVVYRYCDHPFDARVVSTLAFFFWPVMWLYFPGRWIGKWICGETPGQRRKRQIKELGQLKVEAERAAREHNLPL